MGGSVARALLAALASLLFAVPANAAAAVHRADGNLSEWVGDPTWLSGETRVSQGELIYDDWLYDDYGADLDNGPNQPDFRSALAPTRGDYRYPTNSARYGYNGADIRQLRVAADSRGLHLVVYLQTLKARDVAAITLAIDGDRGRSKSTPWPYGAGLTTPTADRYVTFWGTGGWVTDFRGRRERLAAQAVNLSENAIEVDVPWQSLGAIRGRSVRLWLGSGLKDPQAGGYLHVPYGDPTATAPGGGSPTGSTAVFDLAFDSDEQFTRLISHWGEEVQSQALAADNVSALGQDVDLAQLEEGSSDDYAPAPGHFYNRIFHSGQSFGEGINLKNPSGSNVGGSPDPQFLSPFQPYGLYIPEDYQPGTATPLLLMGHSLDVNHNEYIAVSPNLYNQLGDQRSSLVITPLARGMDTWYIDSGFEDVMEAWQDVRDHYTVDEDRTHLSGYSMGGYMTYRMGLLMPDRFATATPYVGPPAYQIWIPPGDPQPTGAYQRAGNTNLIVYNGVNLPFEINNGGADELVPAAGPQEQAQTFREFQNPHEFYFYPTLDHFALILADEWGHTRDWMNRFPRRNETPTYVRYKRYPAMDLPQHGLRFDGAYWADGMVVRTPGDACTPGTACDTVSDYGLIEGYTSGFGKSRYPDIHDVQRTYPGPPAPADVRGTDRSDSGTATPTNYFDVTLSNLRAVTLDMPGAGIDTGQQITGRLSAGGGALTLTLRGQFGPGTTASVETLTPCCSEQQVPVQHTAQGIVLELDVSGQYNLTITPG
jgi:dienelactone hydrolase